MIQKYDPLNIFQIQVLTEQYTFREVGLNPGSTLFPQLYLTESDSFIYRTVEVSGSISIKIKQSPIFF